MDPKNGLEGGFTAEIREDCLQEEKVPLPTAWLSISAGDKRAKKARGTWLSSQSSSAGA